ncbi:hypothetical protein JDV02_000917 [Purpureocillium takamizusanense]|uniref:Uncharacterized protein n=1 Tax=Purpureocillium takamizusanense TaxID=2060973 RepID=A0A9Q8Q8D1_9HYPO|nr:uncharacterized protein JDV02_000917 [Purpureocillium takamizusanense]UNI14272.1 hypothetical protein JDV02_000917 [Purpureocillium takamizusanense]
MAMHRQRSFVSPLFDRLAVRRASASGDIVNLVLDSSGPNHVVRFYGRFPARDLVTEFGGKSSAAWALPFYYSAQGRRRRVLVVREHLTIEHGCSLTSRTPTERHKGYCASGRCDVGTQAATPMYKHLARGFPGPSPSVAIRGTWACTSSRALPP